MKKLEYAIELRNITQEGKRNGGSCGGKNDHRVEKAQAKVDKLLDALEADDDAIQAAMNELEEAIAKQQKTSEAKRASGEKNGKYNH
jgi:enoyl reductase-like protein